MLLSPGKRAGAYELVARIGRGDGFELWGGIGADGRRATLQLWARTSADSDVAFARLWDDQKALAEDTHPAVAVARERFDADGAPVLVFESFPGTLRSRLSGHGGESFDVDTARLVADACEGLCFAHQRGVAHGVLTPTQIGVGGEPPRAHVYGFGGWRLASASKSGALLVTDREPVTAGVSRSASSFEGDAWAVGVTLYTCLLGGRRPRRTELREFSNGDLPPGLEPGAVVELIRRLLDVNTAARLEALNEAAALLRGVSRSVVGPAVTLRQPTLGSRASEPPRQADARTVIDPRDYKARANSPAPLVNQRYEPQGEVRVGGMGRVLRTIDQRTGAVVAVKLLHSVSANSPAAGRFEREARLLSSLQHPAIVEYVDHGWTEDGDPYLAMEWLEGKDLEEHLAQPWRERETPDRLRGTLSIEEILTLAYRLASATALMHEQSVVHRDIKPGNIFLVDGRVERCKLLDLGVARLAEPDASLTQTGALIGTPAYMAPEQAEPKGNLGPAADIWAIGCVVYECLTGQRAFSGHNLMAVLAKIVLEQPDPIRNLRPDVPESLASLVEQMLIKDPNARLRDGRALVRALTGLRATTETRRGGQLEATTGSLTMGEQRFGCVLLAESRAAVDSERIVEAVQNNGGKIALLMNGAFLITPLRAVSVRDDAIRIAHIAVIVKKLEPRLMMAMSVGQMRAATDGMVNAVESEASGAWGDAIDDLVRCLAITPAGQVHVDAITTALIEPHFHVERRGASYHLGTRRDAEGVRTLLGRPIPWVGRQRELLALTSLFDEVSTESSARAIILTAPAGMGKTRLRAEFIKALRADEREFSLLVGQGDSISAGSPFVMLAPAIRRLANILDGESAAERERKLRELLAMSVAPEELNKLAGFIGEMVGVPASQGVDDSLRAARKDPMLMSELMRTAWEHWVRSECERRPVVLVLEDLHWGDVPSVKFVEAALSTAAKLPLLVVALARPELDEVFPALWSKREPERMRLRALSDGASQKLVKQALGDSVDAGVAAMIVERAEGNAFFLEELIRMVAEGASGQLPATVLAMVQSRLDTFGSDAKRLLRAASVFGEVFWHGGLKALLGVSRDAFSVDECLAELSKAELITKRAESRIPGEMEFKFRHALLRDGAYETLTADDRVLGHRLAAEWLLAVGEQDPLVLAEHCARGDDPQSAARWFHTAAEQALEASDLATVVRCCERAVACKPDGRLLGAVRAMEANAAYWQSDYEQASHYGQLAAPMLEQGSATWFHSVSSVIVSFARLGDYDDVDVWFDKALAQEALPDARSEQLICLCRGTFQLIFNGRFAKADLVLERITALMEGEGITTNSGEIDALTLAQANHVRGVRAAHVGDVATFLRHIDAAIENFERAGDTRNARLETTTRAWCYAELGDFAEAERICRQNLARCNELKAQQAVTYGKVNLGYILSATPEHWDEAASVLRQAIEECGVVANLRLEGWARAHLSTVELLRGELEGSLKQSALAVDLLAVSPGLKAWALAAHARALLERADPGDLELALREAQEAMSILRQLGGLLQGESLPPLILARAQHARGDVAAARVTIQDAHARLTRRADRLGSERWRERFLQLPENRQTLQLHDDWVA